MKAADSVGITFANLVLGRGIYNGVVNVTLGAFEFTPQDDKVDPSPVIVSRLRMDMACAEALRDHLTELLRVAQAQPASEGVAAASQVADGAAKH